MNPIPSRQPGTPTTMRSAQTIAEIQQAWCENLDILQNPEPPTDHHKFHKLVDDAQVWVDMLDTSSNAEMPADQKLAERQEIIAYGTSRLHTAVAAWASSLHYKNYEEWCGRWLTGLLGEVVSHYLVGVISSWISHSLNFMGRSVHILRSVLDLPPSIHLL